MTHAILGVIRGKTIELKENPGFSDGEEIEVVLLRPRLVTGEAIGGGSVRRPTAAGMLAHLPPEVDEELNAIIRERKRGTFREFSE
jgi:hypothetical protein